MKWLIIAIHLTIQFAISTSRVFRVFGWSNSDPSGQKNRMCHTHTSEKIPPYGTYVQGENEEWKKKGIIKKCPLLNVCFALPLCHEYFFLTLNTVQYKTLEGFFFSRHNVIRCCLVMSCSLTMTSRKLVQISPVPPIWCRIPHPNTNTDGTH